MTHKKRTDIFKFKSIAERVEGKEIDGEPFANAYQKLNYLAKGYPELAGKQAILAAISIIEKESKETITLYKSYLKNLK